MNEDYADEWEDLTEKEIFIGCLTELQQIRLLLQGAENNTEQRETMFVCDRCGETLSKDERKQHAVKGHNAHESMVDEMFTAVTE